MFTTSAPPAEAGVRDFARRWTAHLLAGNYDAANAMLCHVPGHPGRSVAGGADALRTRIENGGSPVPIWGLPLNDE